ncbi:MAG: DUF483 domain-containing protein [Candidatus Woesearchaeota archaeon]
MNIKQLALIFGSRIKAQEILCLLHDLKGVVRHGFYSSELPAVERFCKEYNLHSIKSKFKVLLMDESKSNFSNHGLRVPENDTRDGMFFVYFSKDEESALLAAYYELVGNNQDFGLILGYPRCCINYFSENFNSTNTNPMVNSTNMFTNISKREEDCVLISHFPCSAECRESIKIGKTNLELIKKIDLERAKEIEGILENGMG